MSASERDAADPHRAERNAPRRRRHRPRAEGGGGTGDRGEPAGGGSSGVAAEGEAEVAGSVKRWCVTL